MVADLSHLQLLLCNNKWVSPALELHHDRGAHCNLQSSRAKDASSFVPAKINENVHQSRECLLYIGRAKKRRNKLLGHVWRGDLLVRLLSSGSSFSCKFIVCHWTAQFKNGDVFVDQL